MKWIRLACLLALALPLAACGDDDVTMMDGGTDAAPEDGGVEDGDVEDGTVEEDSSVTPLEPDPDFDEDYEGVDGIVTTLTETYAPRYGWEQYLSDGNLVVPIEEFGVLHPQPGESHELRDQLAIDAVDWDATALPEEAESAYFAFVFGDPQFVDQDSPTLLPRNNDADLPAYRPWAEYTPALGDGLMRAMRAFHEERTIDYVFVVGDAIENAQNNELEWFISLMNGGMISSDSGARNDVIEGPGNDAYDPIMAAGVPAGVPWLNVVGNHDILVNGNFPTGLIREVNEDPDALAALSPLLAVQNLVLPGLGDADLHRGFLPPAERIAFTLDIENFEVTDLPYRKRLFNDIEEITIPSDADRRQISICDYIEMHADAAGAPLGHGFDAGAVDRCRAIVAENGAAPAGGWYTSDLANDLRVIALSFGPVEGGAEGILSRPPADCLTIGGDSCMGNVEYDQIAFLEAELQRASDDGVGVILLSHQSSGDLVTEPALAAFRSFIASDETLVDIWDRWIPEPNEPMSGEEFRSMIAESGVVVAHLAGHNHINQVRAICADGSALDEGTERCSAGAAGETGYWEITTSGIIDFPHQARFLEIAKVSDTMGAIILTMQDVRMAEGSLLENARFISRAWIAAREGGDGGLGASADRNVVLPFQLPAGLQTAWGAETFEADLASETVLRGNAGPAPTLPVFP